jgi:2-polyprenyl-3-methyl-5-hydroxy-6-metoxy-1,4-benzoquinol methylase
MEKWLIDILRNPQNGNVLKYDENTNLLVDVQSDQSYSIEEGVPVFIQKKDVSVKSSLHVDLNSDFKYVDHYEKDADVFDYFSKHTNLSSRLEEDLLRKQILYQVPKNVKLVLDVGCGSSWLSRELVHKEKNVISLDISLTNTSKALKATPAPNHAAVVADVFNLPFRENTIDCIVASEIMEHLYDPGLFLQKLIYVLKPGGRLIVTTPYKERIEYNLCVHCNKLTPKNAHLHSFDKDKIMNLIQHLNSDNHHVDIKIFNNKLLIKTRMHILMNFIGFKFWRIMDKIACKMYSEAFRIMLIFDK